MGKVKADYQFGNGQFNTLVQSGTKNTLKSINKAEITVNGNGTELNKDEVLRGRTKKKTITQKMALSLVDVVKKKGNLEREKSYWNTYHCQNKIITSEGKLYGKYCKNRFCTLCSGIRKAEIINKYFPVIATWEQPYFVTLTVKAVSAKRLNEVIKNGLIRGFKRIIGKYKKRSQREKSIKLIGVKSLECNFNPVKKTYNPHLHIIVPNKEIADILVKEWLLLWGNKWTNKAAQYSRKVEDRKRDLIEIIKYGSKIFTEPDMKRNSKQKSTANIYVSALDNILCAMKDHRIFDRFGFDLPKSNKEKERMSTMLNKYDEWVFDPKQSNWVNADSDKRLSSYLLPNELRALLEYNINAEDE